MKLRDTKCTVAKEIKLYQGKQVAGFRDALNDVSDSRKDR